MNSERKRIDTLDALRGVASFAVCYFHLTNGNPAFLPAGLVKASGAYGWLGVEIFFVISGFVIPYALHHAGYELKNYGTFVLKRIIRLDPPYLVTIGLILSLYFLSAKAPALWDPTVKISATQILLHLGYVNVFFGYQWINPVFWTLAIEFQYYLLIGLLFPLVSSRNVWVRACTFLALASLSFIIRPSTFIFHFIFLFLLGMLTFQYRTGLLTKRHYLAVFLLLSVGLYLSLGAIVAGVGVSTALIIAFVRVKNVVLKFFGDISYSLYLLHVPVGMTIVILSVRSVNSFGGKMFVLLFATMMSILASYLLYRLVERPSQRLSSAITYRKPSEAKAEYKDKGYMVEEPSL
ncbi:MAG TPA: acyltransferase [Pyrinomonadaceae bacterium]|jgi:peptidoglycan/LPS O-acetylase OafA/YrhL|nr:acyltransferase [Pyrinomonadaceae bacterium]